MFKSYFNLRNVVAIAISLAAVTMFSACGKEDELEDWQRWPPAAELAKFKLGEWTQPPGISSISWGITPETAGLLQLQIQFSDATAETAEAINNYLTSTTVGYAYANGFPMIQEIPQGLHYHSVFETSEDAEYAYAVNYTFDVPGGGEIRLMRQKLTNGSEPGTGLTGNFSIANCTLPTGTQVYAITANPATLLEWLSNGGAASSQGVGALLANKTVMWGNDRTPSNGTYTIILADVVQSGDYYKATNVEITEGAGTVDFSQFAPLPAR